MSAPTPSATPSTPLTPETPLVELPLDPRWRAHLTAHRRLTRFLKKLHEAGGLCYDFARYLTRFQGKRLYRPQFNHITDALEKDYQLPQEFVRELIALTKRH